MAGTYVKWGVGVRRVWKGASCLFSLQPASLDSCPWPAAHPFSLCLHVALPVPYFSSWPHHVSAQVDAEDGDGAQRQWDVGHDEQQEGCDLGDVAGQGVSDGLLQVVEDQAACGTAGSDLRGPCQGPLPPAPSVPSPHVLPDSSPHRPPAPFPHKRPPMSPRSTVLKTQPFWKTVWQFY